MYSYPEETWTNIFHFTQGGDQSRYGDRIPAVFVNKSGFFRISSAINGNPNHSFDKSFRLNKTYVILIEQFYDQFSIKVNGWNVYSIRNKQAQDFRNVKLYISDPWNGPLYGYGKVGTLYFSNSRRW